MSNLLETSEAPEPARTPKLGKVQRISFFFGVGKTLGFIAAALGIELKSRFHAVAPFNGTDARVEFVHFALHEHGEGMVQAEECFEVPTS